MTKILEKLEAVIEEKVENDWMICHYGDINPEWKARQIEKYENIVVAKLLEV